MKIIDGFRLRKLGKEYIVVGEGLAQVNFNKMVSLNGTAAYLWESVEGRDFTVADLLAGTISRSVGSVVPSYLDGDVRIADPYKYLPSFVVEGIGRGIRAFDRRIRGFASNDAILTGPETRTSSPVRIKRGEDRTAIGFDNVYPCGEGAGYAGGITSSASDGCRTAVALMSRFAAL